MNKIILTTLFLTVFNSQIFAMGAAADEAILAQIANLVEAKENFEELKQLNSSNVETPHIQKELAQRIAEIDREIKRLENLFINDGAPPTAARNLFGE